MGALHALEEALDATEALVHLRQATHHVAMDAIAVGVVSRRTLSAGAGPAGTTRLVGASAALGALGASGLALGSLGGGLGGLLLGLLLLLVVALGLAHQALHSLLALLGGELLELLELVHAALAEEATHHGEVGTDHVLVLDPNLAVLAQLDECAKHALDALGGEGEAALELLAEDQLTGLVDDEDLVEALFELLHLGFVVVSDLDGVEGLAGGRGARETRAVNGAAVLGEGE